MSASDEVFILGINMTKFGKHFDKDVVDLGAEAMMAALADGRVTMADMGILAAGNLMGSGGIGQQLQKQVGQTGIPVYNVSNACATGATALRTASRAIKAGEGDMGGAVGGEKRAGPGILTSQRQGQPKPPACANRLGVVLFSFGQSLLPDQARAGMRNDRAIQLCLYHKKPG